MIKNINNIIKEINKNNIIFEIDYNSNKTSEIKSITYIKKDNNNKIIDQAEFDIEINIGKTNNVDSLSTKTEGYSYQVYFESPNIDSLPKTYIIKDNKNANITLKPEKNENGFSERFTVINVPKQDIQDIYEIPDDVDLFNFSLNSNKKEEDKRKSFKYFYTQNIFTQNEFLNKMHKFILKPQENCKNFYDEFKKYENELQIFFENYFPASPIIWHRDFKSIESLKDKNIIKIFTDEKFKEDLKNVIINGFNTYYFNNCKRDYILIRNICFAFLCIRVKELDLNINGYNMISKFNLLLIQLSMEYIDRIKALIAITREYHYSDLESTKLDLEVIKLKTKDEKYSYYTQAMNKFFNIINGLTENCEFFKAIRQFNGIILTDKLTNKNMYSGSILSIKDIQIELFKNAGQFCIIQKGIDNLYGSYWSCSRTMFLNPDTIFGRYFNKKNIDQNIIKRATACTLFVIFHEITGHLKTHINSKNNSPIQVYINDYNIKEIKMNNPDSGFLLEYLFGGNIINCKYFINSKIAEELFNEKLYLSNNFNELREKLEKIENALSPFNQDEKNKEKKEKILKDKINDINQNYYKMTFQELFFFFSNIDNKTLIKMKESDAYKHFLSYYNEDSKKY